jgi:hypothetical protein
MNIKCFYSPVVIDSTITEFSQDSLRLIELWKKSWSNNGWNPIVLSLEDAKKHPLYHELNLKDYSSNLYKIASNNHEYLELCYSRWFAYGCHDGAWSDYDVMNYGFTPDNVDYSKNDPEFIDNIGSCGFASVKGYELIINKFIDVYKNNETLNKLIDFQKKHKHTADISDMHITRGINSDVKFGNTSIIEQICAENFSSDWWRKSKLVHYHNGLWNYFDKSKYQTRSNFIQKERPI